MVVRTVIDAGERTARAAKQVEDATTQATSMSGERK
jgi:hypothetical protein